MLENLRRSATALAVLGFSELVTPGCKGPKGPIDDVRREAAETQATMRAVLGEVVGNRCEIFSDKKTQTAFNPINTEVDRTLGLACPSGFYDMRESHSVQVGPGSIVDSTVSMGFETVNELGIPLTDDGMTYAPEHKSFELYVDYRDGQFAGLSAYFRGRTFGVLSGGVSRVPICFTPEGSKDISQKDFQDEHGTTVEYMRETFDRLWDESESRAVQGTRPIKFPGSGGKRSR